MLTKCIVPIIFQYIQISNHRGVHLKHTMLDVSYIAIKQEKKLSSLKLLFLLCSLLFYKKLLKLKYSMKPGLTADQRTRSLVP